LFGKPPFLAFLGALIRGKIAKIRGVFLILAILGGLNKGESSLNKGEKAKIPLIKAKNLKKGQKPSFLGVFGLFPLNLKPAPLKK